MEPARTSDRPPHAAVIQRRAFLALGAASVLVLTGPISRAAAAEGWVHPFAPLSWYNASNPFGNYDPGTYTTPPHKHRGSDLVANGSPNVRAVRSGRVVYAGRNIANGELGNTVVLQHDTHWSLYAHFVDGSTTVSEGQSVAAGATLGSMGETGNAYGVHLHIEIGTGQWDGSRSWSTLVDPYLLVGGANSSPINTNPATTTAIGMDYMFLVTTPINGSNANDGIYRWIIDPAAGVKRNIDAAEWDFLKAVGYKEVSGLQSPAVSYRYQQISPTPSQP